MKTRTQKLAYLLIYSKATERTQKVNLYEVGDFKNLKFNTNLN